MFEFSLFTKSNFGSVLVASTSLWRCWSFWKSFYSVLKLPSVKISKKSS